MDLLTNFSKKMPAIRLMNLIPLWFIFMGLASTYAQAQTGTVTGKITDQDGKPVPGVNIYNPASSRGTISDLDGLFTIKADSLADQLEFSCIGFVKLTVPAKQNMLVTLEVEISSLSEIVVLGYSEKKKTEISSSVTFLKADEINKVMANSVTDMLNGKVAGVQVQNASGQPGQAGEIRIRGVVSVFSPKQPLVVVDGIIGGAYNPSDIESVTILKDAGATGLYGSQAGGGVIVITTRTGSSKKSVITARVTRGTKEPEFGNFELMNSAELYAYHKAIYPSAVFTSMRPKSLLKQDYDWISNTYKKASYTTAYISSEGGNEKATHFLSMDYMKDDGTLINTNYERISMRSNVKFLLTDKLSIATNITGQYNTSQYPHWSLSEGAFRLMPWDNPYDANGDLVYDIKKAGWYSNVTNNPYHSIQYNSYDNYGLDFAGTLTILYNITPWLKFDSKSTASGGYGKYKEIESPLSYEGAATGGRIFNSVYLSRSYGNTSLLKFEKYFGRINISGLAGVEGGKYTVESDLGGTGTGILAGQQVLGVAGAIEKPVGNMKDASSFSVLSQVNADFSKKYFVTLSLRRDGSSKFSPNYKYGNFYAASASWLVSNEQFMKQLDFINYLKIRASYGAVGNETFPDDDLYPYFPSYTSIEKYNGQTSYYPSNAGNYNLTWETSYPFNVGLDIELLKRLELNLDYYNTITKNLLFKDPLPSSQGYDFQWKNVGEIQNSGVEVSVKGKIVERKNLLWELNLNLSANKNGLLKLSNKEGVNNIIVPAETLRQILEPNEAAFDWYMPKWLGVDPENGKPVWEKIIYDPLTGKETEREKTSVYNEATFQSMGSPFPKFMGGFGTLASYRGFSLSAAFTFVYGNKIYHATRQQLDNDGANMNVNAFKLQQGMSRWEEVGDKATHPQPKLGGNNNAHEYSSRYLEDGSYLRLRNITFSYQIPNVLLEKVKIQGAKLSVSADNLFTLTKFTGMDPDVPLYPGSWILPGVSSFKYPISKNVSAGIEIRF